VLKRAGHTEATVDLSRPPASLLRVSLREIVTEDKSEMARLPDLGAAKSTPPAISSPT
jgi:3,4-dihydroxy-2-butanone 4-phosphate synthase